MTMTVDMQVNVEICTNYKKFDITRFPKCACHCNLINKTSDWNMKNPVMEPTVQIDMNLEREKRQSREQNRFASGHVHKLQHT